MDALKQFSIPIKSIGNTTHQFDFQVNKSFFSHFEDSIIEEGEFKIRLEIDKRTSVMDLTFIVEGTIKTECDRCLADITQQVKGNHMILAKFSESTEEEAEVIYLHPLAHEFNVARYIYEFICLSIPFTKACEGDLKIACDETVQAYLAEELEEEEIESDEDDKPSNNPFLDALKDFNQGN